MIEKVVRLLFRKSFIKSLEIAMPRSIVLEASSICQLKCPECPTGRGENKFSEVGVGTLNLPFFKSVIDNNTWLRTINLVNWGEIFLNKSLPEIIKYASSKNVQLSAHGGTNFNFVSDAALEAMVKYGFGRLMVSVDGATQQSYSKYRVGGDIDNVLNNVKRLLALKKKYNTTQPEVVWKYVVFGHNEDEIPMAKKMAEEMDIPIRFVLQWNDSFSPVKNPERVKELTGLSTASQQENIMKNGRPSSWFYDCANLWALPNINWDGKIQGCCVNTWGNFGIADSENLLEGLNNDKIKYARKMLMGRAEEDAAIPCTQCHHYKFYKENNAFFTESEVFAINKTGFIASAFGERFSNFFLRYILPAFLKIKYTLKPEKF